MAIIVGGGLWAIHSSRGYDSECMTSPQAFVPLHSWSFHFMEIVNALGGGGRRCQRGAKEERMEIGKVEEWRNEVSCLGEENMGGDAM